MGPATKSEAGRLQAVSQWVARAATVTRKELAEIVRQPRLVAVLVLGPFLILLVFGLNLSDADPELRTIVVLPPESPLDEEARRIEQVPDVRVVDIRPDRESALEELRTGTIDLVVVVPGDPLDRILQGEQARIAIFHDRLDPVESLVIALSGNQAADTINQRVWQGLVRSAQLRAGRVEIRVDQALRTVALIQLALELGAADRAETLLVDLGRQATGLQATLGPFAAVLDRAEGPLSTDDPADEGVSETLASVQAVSDQSGLASLAELQRAYQQLRDLRQALQLFQELPPEVLVDPFTDTTERVTAGSVQLTDFYAPAVVVLLIQHVIVTMLGLSVVRDDELGTSELFRVSPISSIHLVLGRYLAHMFLAGIVGVVLVVLLRFGLDVPIRGSVWTLLLSMLGVLFASAGVGFASGLLATSDRQAVQNAMMVLLASIFIGGFILTLERFTPAMRVGAAVLPATHGIQLFREEMLRGGVEVRRLVVLFGVGLLLAVFSWGLYRWRLRAD